MFRSILTTFVLLGFVASASAQQWKAVTEALIKAENPGYGKLCGVAVDHATGHLIVNLSDKGFYRSTDQGESWKALGKPFKGRTETPGCLMLDPRGGTRLVTALVYGSPIIVSSDRGETWKSLDQKAQHVDWCAVDWTDPDMRFILTLRHESGGILLCSHDAGKSFNEVPGKGFGPAWIFDNRTAVVAREKSNGGVILRTTDAGKTFEPCGDFQAKALPRWHNNTGLYWVVAGGLIRTRDEGKSWTRISDLKGGLFGPIFGKTADHLFILTQAGIVESSDGGKTWGKAIPAPKEMQGLGGLAWMEYDPVHDTLYVMKMTSELYRWQRK